MFKCQATGFLSKPNEGAHRLVTHIRNKTYYRHNRKSGQDEIAGHGTEIVREILVSKEHYAKLMAQGFQPQVVREKE
jgi:hypothetical protein